MERKLLIGVVILLAIQTLVLMVDMSRRSEPILRLKESLDQLDQSVQHMTGQQRALQDELLELRTQIQSGDLVASSSSAGPSGDSSVAAESQRDGAVKTGVNFLKSPSNDVYDPARAGGAFTFFETEPTSFNDVLVSLYVTSQANSLVNDSLCYWDLREPYSWIQGLATSVVISEDYKTYTFTLRRGVYWQIPRIASEAGYEWLNREVELTAQDFKLYIDLVTNPNIETNLRGYYEGCSAEAPDDYTLVVRWDVAQYTNIDFTLGLSPVPHHVFSAQEDGTPIPEEQFEAYFNDHWFDREAQLIGVGRYRLAEVERGKRVRFERYAGYYGEPGHFNEIVWDGEVTDPGSQLVGFKNNQVHRHGLTPTQYKAEIIDGNESRFATPDPANPKAGRDGPFGWERVKSSSFSCVAWNMRRPQLRDVRVRQALAHALDRERLAREIFYGLGDSKLGPTHPDSPYYNANLEQFAYDLSRAEQLLEEAGWTDSNADGWRDAMIDGERVDLRLDMVYYAQSKTSANMLSVYRDDLKKIGIDLNTVPVEAKEWERRANDRDFHGFSLSWMSGLEADYVQLWHSDGAEDPNSSNYPGYGDPEVDRLAEQLRVTFAMDERYDIAREIQQRIHEAQPYLFINAGEGILIWQNQQYADGAPRELLGGMAWVLDNYNSLLNRRASAFGPLYIER